MSKLIVNSITNLGEYQGVTNVFNLNTTGKMETIEITTSGNKNNYALGVNTSNKVHSYVHMNATNSFWISGISSVGMEENKKITIRNTANNLATDCGVIAFNRQDNWISSDANCLIWQQNTLPVFCMPQEEIEWEYRQGYWRLVTGTRYGSTSTRGVFDEQMNPNMFSLASSGTAAGSITRLAVDNYSTGTRIWLRARRDRVIATNDYVTYTGGWSLEHKLGHGSVLIMAHNEYRYTPNTTNNFNHWTGLHAGYIGDNNYNYAVANNQPRAVGLLLTSNTWNFITRNNYTSTISTASHVAMPQESGKIRWFAFINGDASRVDFCIANDAGWEGGDYWWRHFYTHTTDIPRIPFPTTPTVSASNVRLSLGTTMAKFAGSGLNNDVYIGLLGMIGKGQGMH